MVNFLSGVRFLEKIKYRVIILTEDYPEANPSQS
jgi:hypothetical protein